MRDCWVYGRISECTDDSGNGFELESFEFLLWDDNKRTISDREDTLSSLAMQSTTGRLLCSSTREHICNFTIRDTKLQRVMVSSKVCEC